MKRWVLWRLEKNKNGKVTKVPYQVNGRHAATNNPQTWATFNAVVKVADQFDGIGFVLTDSEFAAFDLDDCRDANTEAIHPWAQALVERCHSYTEITPSGTGLRIIGYGAGPKVHRKLPVPNANGMTCEPYRQAERYITISGNVFKNAPLANIDKLIDEVVAELDAEKKTKTDAPRKERKTKLPQELRLMLHLKGDKPADYPSRSELLWTFICKALRLGVDENDIIAACLDEAYSGNSIYDHVHENGGASYVKRQIERAINDSGTSRDGGKAIIRVERAGRYNAWRAAERALIRARCPIYVRAGCLVQPLWRWEKTSEKNRDALITTFVKLNEPRLSDITARHAATFQKYQLTRAQWEAVDPPNDVIEALLEAGHWGFPTVVGIVNSPTMRPDGSLLTNPGYDEATQLWYKPAADIELPPIAERPNKEDAAAALQLLKDLLAGFPLVTDTDWSVAIAAILTVVLRGAFEVAPLFFISAPEAGTGKTYLVKVISTIATGRAAGAVVGTKKEEEMEKRLSAAAFEARPILNLNNLTFDLESALLCQMVTEGIVEIRPFGKNDQLIICDCRGMTAFANGNNIAVVGDLVRRTLTAHLDAKVEQPETRDFEFDPVERVKGNRGAYLSSVFTIARAYMAAGSPKQKGKNIAGFETWARLVRDPLMWLGMTDPVVSMDDARARDPQRAELSERLSALINCFGVGKDFTASDVHALAMEPDKDGFGRTIGFKRPDLFNAYSRDGRNTSAKAIGWSLKKDLGRMSKGYRLELIYKDAHLNAGVYQVVGKPIAQEPF